MYIDYGTIYGKDYPYAVLQDKNNDLDILWNLHWHFHILLRDILQDKIIIYGYNSLGQELKRILNLMDKDILYFMDDKIGQKNIADIVNEDMTDKIILVTKFENRRCPALLELEKKGLKYNADFKDIHTMSDNSIRDSRFGIYGCELEPMLGLTFRYPETSHIYDQYVVLGNTDEKNFKIMILGNSTSDIGEYKPEKSWVEYLYEMIHCNDVTIFGGAIGGYNARQECLKLMRDIGTIKPNIVISYSGVNDAYPMEVPEHPFLHTYQVIAMDKAPSSYHVNTGMENRERTTALWFRMEKTMEAMCEVCGCKFYGIFQPAVYGKKVLVGKEKMIPLYGINKYTTREYSLDGAELRYETMKKEVVDTESFHTDASLFDFSGLFVNSCEEIFKDGVHLYENGNKRVAEEIFKIIKPSLKNFD